MNNEVSNYRNRFIKYTIDSTTNILVDSETGIEYVQMYPTKAKQANESVTFAHLVDPSGFPKLNAEWLEAQNK